MLLAIYKTVGHNQNVKKVILIDIFSSDKVQAALIGAVVAVLIMVLKDVIFKLWLDNRKIKRDELKVFRQYANPLSNATKSLLWRLNEILNQKHKSSYLFTKFTTRYARYKRASTVYRLAALLGWLRAFSKELTLLKSKDDNQLQKIKTSINKFSASLADGSHVETERLQGLIELWKFNFKDCQTNSAVASSIDHEIKDFIFKKQAQSALELTDDDKLELCTMVANDMTEGYKVKKITSDIINQTMAQAIQLCSLKESWIYRDWQDAIGDFMLKENKDELRKYDVIGFYEFDKRFKENDGMDKDWISRLESVFYDLDVTGANKADMRLKQLDNIVKSTSKLMLSLTESDKQLKKLMSKTLELAEKLKK